MIDLDSLAQSSFNERRFDVMICVALNNKAHQSLAKTKLLTKWREVVSWKVYNVHTGRIVKAGFDDEETAKDWLELRKDLLTVDFLVEEMDEEEEEEYQEQEEEEDEEVEDSFADDDDDDDDVPFGTHTEDEDDDDDSLDDDEDDDVDSEDEEEEEEDY